MDAGCIGPGPPGRTAGAVEGIAPVVVSQAAKTSWDSSDPMTTGDLVEGGEWHVIDGA